MRTTTVDDAYCRGLSPHPTTRQTESIAVDLKVSIHCRNRWEGKGAEVARDDHIPLLRSQRCFSSSLKVSSLCLLSFFLQSLLLQCLLLQSLLLQSRAFIFSCVNRELTKQIKTRTHTLACTHTHTDMHAHKHMHAHTFIYLYELNRHFARGIGIV